MCRATDNIPPLLLSFDTKDQETDQGRVADPGEFDPDPDST